MEQQARKQLALRIRRLREYKDWTAEELAHQAGVSTRTVSRLETAQVSEPHRATLARVAKALGEDQLNAPRVSLEEVEQATQTQLDVIAADVKETLRLLRQLAGVDPRKPPGELGRRAEGSSPTAQDRPRAKRARAADARKGNVAG